MDVELRLTRKIIWNAARCLRKIVKGYVLEMDSVTIHSHLKNVGLQHVFKLIQIDRLNIFQKSQRICQFFKILLELAVVI